MMVNVIWQLSFDFNWKIFVCCIIVVLFLSLTSAFAQETEFKVESTNVQVFRDGLVRVTQTFTVNETLPVFTIPLLTSSVNNFLVVDENETVLDYELVGAEITVYSLGATNVLLQYDTNSLTTKEFDIWSLIVETPYNITVVLPDESTIIDLSDVPDSIDTEGTSIVLSLFPNQWEISYVFPLVPAADFEISEFAVTPSEVKPGEDVIVSFRITNIGGQTGSITVPLKINQTTENTRIVTLEKGQSTTVEFKVVKQTIGKYIVEVDGFAREFDVVNTPSDGEPSNGAASHSFPIEYIILATVLVATGALVVFLVFRRRGPNVERIFKENSQLNKEEKDVILFLVENGGKAFEAEIRERFPDIPRTSLWRMIRRFEKLEIVETKKIGLENRVELKK